MNKKRRSHAMLTYVPNLLASVVVIIHAFNTGTIKVFGINFVKRRFWSPNQQRLLIFDRPF